MDTAKLELDNSFWRFSLAVYAADGVEDECLALQQEFDIDVNLLLFSAWIGSERGINITQDDIRSADATIESWRNRVVRPLRETRRVLKQARTDREDFRRKVKALELEAEQIEQATLYNYACERWPEVGLGRSTKIAANVRTFMQYATDGKARADDEARLRSLIEAANGLSR
jgi:uncharacterized protein (TIGR02444 family)